jgi:hypothetical protein
MPAAPPPISFPIYRFQVGPVEFYRLHTDDLQLGAATRTNDKLAFYGPRFQFDRVLTVYTKHSDHSDSPSAERVLSIIAANWFFQPGRKGRATEKQSPLLPET